MTAITLDDILEMPVTDRISLVQSLWESIEQFPEEVFTISDDQRAELTARLEAHHKNPQTALPWEDVKAKLQA